MTGGEDVSTVLDSRTEAPFNRDQHWLSAIVESDWPIPTGNALLSSAVTFGTVPNVLFVAYAHLRGGVVGSRFLFAIAMTVLLLNLGPYLVWYYDERVLPEFLRRATELLPRERVDEYARRYDAFFARRWWPLSAGLSILMGYTFVRSTSFLVRVGVFEAGGPFHYLIFALILWVGVVGGVGFHGVLTTLLLIWELSSEELSIDPLHPDKLGGLSVVGYYSIRTTVVFSFGSLFIPLAYQFVTLSRYGHLIYVIVGVYTLFLLLSFVVPTVKVNRRANELRESVLDGLREEYRRVQAKLSRHGEIEVASDARLDELILEMQARRIRNEYEDYKQVRLYPLEVQILARLVGSVLLPLAFLLLEVTLTRFF